MKKGSSSDALSFHSRSQSYRVVNVIRPGAWKDSLQSEVTEGGEVIKVCAVELEGLQELLHRGRHKVRWEH